MTDRNESRRQALSAQTESDVDSPERPTKVAVSIRLDADIVDYFKAQGPGWQSRINAQLRELMLREHRDAVYETFTLTGQDHPFVHHFAETAAPLRLAGLAPQSSLAIKSAR